MDICNFEAGAPHVAKTLRMLGNEAAADGSLPTGGSRRDEPSEVGLSQAALSQWMAELHRLFCRAAPTT